MIMDRISEIPQQTPIAEKPIVEMPADPWRCEECGGVEVQHHIWLDSNTGLAASVPTTRDEFYCAECDRNTYQVRESTLMRHTVEPWWKDGTTEEDREIITGLNPENFSPKDDRKAFRDACDVWWRGKTNDEKIRLWRQAAAPEVE